jgi:hypothetical protein
VNKGGSVVLVAVAAASAVMGLRTHAASQTSTRPGQESPSTNQHWTPRRTPDGQPDIQGFWKHAGMSTGKHDRAIDLGQEKDSSSGRRLWAYNDEFADDGPVRRVTLSMGVVDPKDGRVPFQPWAKARQDEIIDNAADPPALRFIDTAARCLPSGVPRTNYAIGYVGYQFIQGPGYVVLITEFNHQYRLIPLDGRPHLSDKVRLFNGDSRGRWEGNTLVVDTTNIAVPQSTGEGWLDMNATVFSDAIRVVERYTSVDQDTIAYEAMIDDPKVFTRPWKMAGAFVRPAKGYKLFEYACHEGNYALKGILNGRRAVEKRKMGRSRSTGTPQKSQPVR